MSDELLPYYNRELSFLRRLGAGFARAHPKIAGRLRLGVDVSEDPHVERLIQAFAYLSARTRHKLEDDFPELTDSLLGVLYPHYQLPIPAMAIVELELDPTQTELTEGHVVRRGAEIESEPIDGEPCRFRTSCDATLWPLRVAEARLAQPPMAVPATPFAARASSILRIALSGPDRPIDFSTLALSSLRFFLKGQNQHVFLLYQLLFNHTMGVALASSPTDPEPMVLGPEALRPVGFGRDRGSQFGGLDHPVVLQVISPHRWLVPLWAGHLQFWRQLPRALRFVRSRALRIFNRGPIRSKDDQSEPETGESTPASDRR